MAERRVKWQREKGQMAEIEGLNGGEGYCSKG